MRNPGLKSTHRRQKFGPKISSRNRNEHYLERSTRKTKAENERKQQGEKRVKKEIPSALKRECKGKQREERKKKGEKKEANNTSERD